MQTRSNEEPGLPPPVLSVFCFPRIFVLFHVEAVSLPGRWRHRSLFSLSPFVLRETSFHVAFIPAAAVACRICRKPQFGKFGMRKNEGPWVCFSIRKSGPRTRSLKKRNPGALVYLRIAAQVKYKMDINAGSAAVGAGTWPGTRQHIAVPCSDRCLIGTAGTLLSFFLFCASSGFEPEGRGRGCQANCLLGLCRISRTEFKDLHHPAPQRFFNQPRCFALEGPGQTEGRAGRAGKAGGAWRAPAQGVLSIV